MVCAVVVCDSEVVLETATADSGRMLGACTYTTQAANLTPM